MAIKSDDDVRLDTDKMETGVLVHVLGADGELAYLGGDEDKPKQIRVRSIRSKIVKDHDLKEQKLQAAVRGQSNKAKVIPNDIFIPKRCAQVAVEFINFSAAAPSQLVSFDDAHAYFRDPANEHHRDQVFETASNDALYAEDAATPPGKDVAAPAAAQSTSESSSTDS